MRLIRKAFTKAEAIVIRDALNELLVRIRKEHSEAIGKQYYRRALALRDDMDLSIRLDKGE